jgi:class 3 adenylate cyclase/pimeloyl-ACP methyl ester carboxylesterase
MERPETVYARSGDAYLAYQVFGEGPVSVIAIPGRVSNVELMWDDPFRVAFFSGLAEFARVVVFDKRGVGVSDRSVAFPPLEEQVDDVRAVMDAAGVERACLFGTRDGAALAALFAATSPRRVTALALWQPQVRGSWAPDYPWGWREREMPWYGAAFASAEHAEWTIRTQMPDRSDDPAHKEFNRRLFLLSSSPSSLAAQGHMLFDSDVRETLAAVRVPALVMHGGIDFADESRYVAGRLPLARYVEFPEIRGTAPYHSADSRSALLEMRAFIEATWDATEGSASERVLATVLFTDLVGSTERAVALGPRWHELLREHNAVIRREIARFRGREIDTAGDGFFASGFDGPARAIRCGCAIRDAMQALDLHVRIGVHTGECDVVDGKLAGVAVAIGARIASNASAEEVLVSGTVRDLVAGSGITFTDRGAHELRGIPGEWHLFAADPAPTGT